MVSLPWFDMRTVVVAVLLLEMLSLLVSPLKDFYVWRYAGVFQSDRVFAARTTLKDSQRYVVDGIFHPTPDALRDTTVVFQQAELARAIAYTLGFSYDPESQWSVKTDREALQRPSDAYFAFVDSLQATLANTLTRTALLSTCSSAATSFNVAGGCWFQDSVGYSVPVEDFFMYLLNQLNTVAVGVVCGRRPSQRVVEADVVAEPGASTVFSLRFSGGFDGLQLTSPRRLNSPVVAAMSTSIEANLCLRNYSLERLLASHIDPTWSDITAVRTRAAMAQDPLFVTRAMLPDVDTFLACRALPTFRERYDFLRGLGLREIYARESFVLITTLLLKFAQHMPGIEDLVEPVSYHGEQRQSAPNFEQGKNIFLSPAVERVERTVIVRSSELAPTPFLVTNDLALAAPFWHAWGLLGWGGNRTAHDAGQFGFSVARQISRCATCYEYLPLSRFADDSGVIPGTKHPLVGAQQAPTPTALTYTDFADFLTTYWDVSSFNSHMASMVDRYKTFPPGGVARRPGWPPGYPEYSSADGAPCFLTTDSLERGTRQLKLSEDARKAFFFHGILSEMYSVASAPEFDEFLQRVFLVFVGVVDGGMPEPFRSSPLRVANVRYVLTDVSCAFLRESVAQSATATTRLTFWGVDDGGFCSTLNAETTFGLRRDIYDAVSSLLSGISPASTQAERASARAAVLTVMRRWERESKTDLAKTPREILLVDDDAGGKYGYASGDLRRLFLFVLSPPLTGRANDSLVPSQYRLLRRIGDIVFGTETAFGDKSVEGGVTFLTVLSILTSLLNALWTTAVLILPNIVAVCRAPPPHVSLSRPQLRLIRAIDLTSAAFFTPLLLPFNFISAFIPAVRVVNASSSGGHTARDIVAVVLTCWRLSVALLFCVSPSHLPSRLVWCLSLVVAAVMVALGELGVASEFEPYSRAVVLALVTFALCLVLLAPVALVYRKRFVVPLRDASITSTLGIHVAQVNRVTLHALTRDSGGHRNGSMSIVTALELAASLNENTMIKEMTNF
ncbi:hypothetical protein ATCC90586_004780 [Pythium insidiosum]|nr:hypothetical protein ATCC90586_004780 [Pythium insidiosum]